MAVFLVLVMLILAMAGHSNSAQWCVCKEGMNEGALQKTLDYACGAGAECSVTHLNGPCFNPNTIRAHCNYAVNSYFQKKGQAPGSCDFAGTAMVVNSDPSTAGCAYPASASASATPTNPGTTTPTVNTPTTGTSPLITTPNAGAGMGGINNGLGPSGNGINTDSVGNDGISLKNSPTTLRSLATILLFSGAGFWWA